ncbi:MAG: hypothetical protein DMG62_10825 [Acidobacteria bacterium]|nr:MAG: hypothetical protein DMG62_10825 [Acidobacteriota bacterium]
MKAFTRNIRYWLPTLFWLGVIAYESFRLSSAVTGGWLWQILHLLRVQMSAESFAGLHHLLRKSGHFTGYGLLCILLFRSWFHTLLDDSDPTGHVPRNSARSGQRWKCAALAVGMTLATAILDEWHQSSDLSRTGTPWDVALDLAGGVLFLAIALFGLKLWQARRVEKLEEVSA